MKEPSDQYIYGAFSRNNPGIHREASAAGNVRRSGARGLSETSTSLIHQSRDNAAGLPLTCADNGVGVSAGQFSTVEDCFENTARF